MNKEAVILTYDDIIHKNWRKFYRTQQDALKDLKFFRSNRNICGGHSDSMYVDITRCPGVNCSQCPCDSHNIELFKAFIDGPPSNLVVSKNCIIDYE